MLVSARPALGTINRYEAHKMTKSQRLSPLVTTMATAALLTACDGTMDASRDELSSESSAPKQEGQVERIPLETSPLQLSGPLTPANDGTASRTGRAGLCNVRYGRAWNPDYTGVTAYTNSGAPCVITKGTTGRWSGDTGWQYTPYAVMYSVWSAGTEYAVIITNQPW